MPQDRIPLARIVNPRSVAVVGASEDVGKFGGRVIHSLIRHGYSSRLLPINPIRPAIRGIRLRHVPYCGSAPALAALLAGDVDLQFDPVTIPAIKDGRLVDLAAIGGTRSPE